METVYVGLSGGVDSSVAAALLQRQGYRVVGAHIINWTAPVGGVDCPWKQDLADAKAVAAAIGIPLKIFDFQTDYKRLVVDYMVAEYAAGRTPNPDVRCNQEIKFRLFLDAALADGADLVATGHYARVDNGRLLAAADSGKDQTYFLYRVDPAALSKTIFPLGGLTKPEVRALATELGLPTAAKPDSQGICFVGEVGLRDFLRQFIATAPGPVIHDGVEIGTHDGAALYTIGQRHGLGMSGGPYFVTGKDMATNTVFVTRDPADLEIGGIITLEQTHWLGDPPQADKVYNVRLRHRGELVSGQCEALLDGEGLRKPTAKHGGEDLVSGQKSEHWQITLARAERAVSPGQSAVVYDGDMVMGGGIITSQAAKLLSKTL